MRISDWSSDVCSSDLRERMLAGRTTPQNEFLELSQSERDPGRTFDVPADMVIKALGFDPEELPNLFGAPDLSVTRWGTLRVDHQTMMTSLPGVFAAGDIVRGASRSEERRVGKECVSTCRSRWSPYH